MELQNQYSPKIHRQFLEKGGPKMLNLKEIEQLFSQQLQQLPLTKEDSKNE